MGVQRLPDPGLLPTSQEAGGTVHSNALAQTAPGTDPGFDGGTLTYNVSTDAADAPAGQDRNDRELIATSGGKDNMDAPFPQSPKFGGEAYGNAGLWRKTPSSG
jgi:hypothetical protein